MLREMLRVLKETVTKSQTDHVVNYLMGRRDEEISLANRHRDTLAEVVHRSKADALNDVLCEIEWGRHLPGR
jgi:hypothetical protein